jgi:hypothetical protein
LENNQCKPRSRRAWKNKTGITAAIFREAADGLRFHRPLSSCKDENHSARRCRHAATPGKSSRKFTNPERVGSIPQIPFVIFNFMPSQKFAQLILKRNLPVMFLLPRDVIPHRDQLRKADGENTVAALPRKIPQLRAFGFEPHAEPRLTSLTISAAVTVRDRAHKICTWSATPPAMTGWQPSWFKMPPR